MDNNLKNIRTKSEITQEKLARIIGDISAQQISRIERGFKASKPTARKIAAALNEKPESIFPDFSNLRSW
jgi:DNA-binding XRE family transcriptional regulator